jgi:hypothetical protein
MAKDPLHITIVWHPNFKHGADYAGVIASEFESLGMVRERRRTGVPVRVRCQAFRNAGAPRPIDWQAAQQHLIVYFLEENLTCALSPGGEWNDWQVEVTSPREGVDVTFLPIAMYPAHSVLPHAENAQAVAFHEIRKSWDIFQKSDGRPTRPARWLVLCLLNMAGNLARRQLRSLQHDDETPVTLDRSFPVFLSHTSASGRPVVEALARQMLAVSAHQAGVSPFLDRKHLEWGNNYRSQFEETIKQGIFVAIHTDDYGTRHFCRWEMVTAKRHHRPILVVNKLHQGEARSFPYSGNVPVTVLSDRFKQGDEDDEVIEPDNASPPGSLPAPVQFKGRQPYIDEILMAIMGEALRFLIFQCRVRLETAHFQNRPRTILSRPPELADIAEEHKKMTAETNGGDFDPDSLRKVIVYPDPPLDEVELDLVHELSSPLVCLTLSELKAAETIQSAGRIADQGHQALGASRHAQTGRIIGISASESDDQELSSIGIVSYRSPDDDRPVSAVWTAMSEIVTVIVQLKARLLYGGGLRKEELTLSLFKDLAEAYRILQTDGPKPIVHSLATAHWAGKQENPGGTDFWQATPELLFNHVTRAVSRGEVHLLWPGKPASGLILTANSEASINAKAFGGVSDEFSGEYSSPERLGKLMASVQYDQAHRDSYTQLRQYMASLEAARFLVGGKTGSNFGHYPGIMEEAAETLEAGGLVFPLAGFGGAAHDTAFYLGLIKDTERLSDRKAGQPGVHSNHGAIAERLGGLAPAYLERLHGEGLYGDVRQLALTDNPEAIALLARKVLLKAFAAS